MENGGLTPEEREAFDRLSSHKTPPVELEAKVISALKEEGLIKTKTVVMNTNLKWAISIAASVLIFFAGSYWGKQSLSTSAINPTLGYMLILHEDENFQPGDPMAMFEEYSTWMQNTDESGITISGQELSPEAVLVKSNNSISLDEEASERITGYFILEAKTKEEALKVARLNPHIKYGGTIEVKPFMVR